MEQFKANLIFTNDIPLQAFTQTKNGQAYPCSLDMRDLVLKTEDQGKTGQCAAYTATSWVQSVMWRRTGLPVNYNPLQLYQQAKKIDGMPNQEGTSMQAIMKSIILKNWCPGCTQNDIKFISNEYQLKRAIHRYGTCLLGMAITSSWYNHIGKLVLQDGSGSQQGGHAIICTGYNDIGVFIQNSWGQRWGKYGFAVIPWKIFNQQFRIGAYIKNCLNDVEN